MKLDLNRDVLEWLDANRGETSRQKYIVQVLRNYMSETESKKGYHETTNICIRANEALSQVG